MWGVLKTRSDFDADFRPLLLKIDAFKVYDFYYMGFKQTLVEKKIKNWGGEPPFGPP